MYVCLYTRTYAQLYVRAETDTFVESGGGREQSGRYTYMRGHAIERGAGLPQRWEPKRVPVLGTWFSACAR